MSPASATHTKPELRALVAGAQLGLANLLLDAQEHFERAESLYEEAFTTEPLFAPANLAWLYLLSERLDDATRMRGLVGDWPPYGLALLDAAIHLAQDNFGSATEALASALGGELATGGIDLSDDIERLLRLAVKKGYGERLISWFEQTGFADRVAPVYVAFKAYVRNGKLLLDVNPEVRKPAQVIYDRLHAARRYKAERAPKPVKAKGGRKSRGQAR